MNFEKLKEPYKLQNGEYITHFRIKNKKISVRIKKYSKAKEDFTIGGFYKISDIKNECVECKFFTICNKILKIQSTGTDTREITRVINEHLDEKYKCDFWKGDDYENNNIEPKKE